MTLGFSPLGSAPLAGDDGVLSAAAVAYIATGIATTTGVGAPLAISIAPLDYSATGIGASTAFGVPSASAAASVAGFSSTQIGTPTAAMAGVYIAAGIAPTTALGTPSTPATAFTVTGIQPAYVRSTRVGKPSRLVYNYTASASQGARVGSPKAVTTSFTCLAAGISSGTLFGQAASLAVVRGKVGAIVTSQVGTPSSRFTQFGFVDGFGTTRFGQPRVPLAPFDLSIHIVKRKRPLFARVP